MSFRTYEDRARERRDLFLGGAVAVGAALLNPRSRATITRSALKGMERVGRRFGKVSRELPLTSTAAELDNLFEKVLPRAAQLAAGERLARERISQALVNSSKAFGAPEAIKLAKEISVAGPMRKFLMNEVHDTRALFRNKEMQRLLERPDLNADHRIAIANALEEARKRIPKKDLIVQDQIYQNIQAQMRAAVGSELGRMGRDPQVPLLNRQLQMVRRAIGVEQVRLGQGSTKVGPLQDLHNGLARYAPSDTVKQLALGRVVRHEGKEYDLRGFFQVLDQARSSFTNHFQVPLAPGASGINPLQLFPWRHGVVNRPFGEVSHLALDAQLRAHLGSESRHIGKDVYKIGEKWLATDWTSGLDDLGIEGNLRTGLYGFMRRRAQSIEKAQVARAGEGPQDLNSFQNLVHGFLAKDEDSTWSRLSSVVSKFGPQSNWAPRVLSRVLETEPGKVDLEDFQRAAGFLSTGKLSGRHQRNLVRAGLDGFEDETLRASLQNLDQDQSVVDFYRHFLTLEDADGVKRSSQFTELLNHLKASPEGVLDRFDPSADRAVLGWNFLGQESHKNSIDILRDGILDEVAGRLSEDDPFGAAKALAGIHKRTSPFGKLGQKGINAEDDEALAWAYGRGLQQIAEPRKGEDNLDNIRDAIRAFQNNPEAQEVAGRFTANRAKIWDTHVQPEEHVLRTSELFSQRGRTLIGELNTRLKENNGDWGLAFRDTIRGPWGRQYAAFFTGNQKDVTETTLMLEYFPRKLNEYFNEFGIPLTGRSLGLPDKDLLSGGSIMAGLLGKRVLPAVLGYELYRYTDYKADQLGLPGPSDLYANIRADLGEQRARLFGDNILGMDRDLLPGLEKFLSDRNVEEERKHQESGYEPVRKGRFWSLGSRSEFWGDRVSYYLPSAVRAAKSDWQGAENADLNTHDYWAHSWVPLPENGFMGPVSRLLDPGWWERKHATGPNADRPYPISSEAFDPNTAHGPVLNSALGWLIKPQEVLHPELVPRSAGGTATRDQIRQINESVKQGQDRRGIALLVGGGGMSGTGGGGGYPEMGFGSPGVLAPRGTGDITGLADVTSGGELTVKTIPAGFGNGSGIGPWSGAGGGGYTGNNRPSGSKLSRKELMEINQRIKAGMGGGVPRSPAGILKPQTPGVFADVRLDQIGAQSAEITATRNLVDLAGLYGFMAESVHPTAQDGLVLPTAQQATGYNQRFYEMELGGLGGTLSEVGRRFLPRRQRFDGEWNPVANTMASWMPGPEYFLDFKHGDPYAKVPRGEMRLPGEAYERLNPHIKLMETRASSIGGSIEEIMRGMLFLKEPLSNYGEDVTEFGDRVHLMVQNRWKEMGVLLGAEDTVYNKRLGISGHYDAIIETQNGPALTDIKTVSEKRYQTALSKGAFEEHASQLTFYMHETGVKDGFITYVNRDALKAGRVETFMAPVAYDQGRFDRSIHKVETARERLLQMTKDGTIHRGDLYDPVTRFEILSDVAPYSENYNQLKQYLTQENTAGKLLEEDNARFQAAKDRAAEQKKTTQIFPYHFKNVEVERQGMTVEKILDANTVLTKEGVRVRLAGVEASNERIEAKYGVAPEGMTPGEWMFSHFGIHAGSRISVLLETDPLHRQENDVLRTSHGVIMAGDRNVNHALMQLGVAAERETDWTDTGVAARFTPAQIKAGARWETLAHQDTPFHTKFLKVRSPLEELERGLVYGKRTGSWLSPIRDYIGPSIESFVSRTPEMAGIGLGLFAQYFARTPEAKIGSFLGGLALGGMLSTGRILNEATDGIWKPERVRTRESLEEYWDVLKYVKVRGLAAREERLARLKEGVNIGQLTKRLHVQGESRKRKRRELEEKKRSLIEADQVGNADQIERLTGQIEKLSGNQGAVRLGKHATKALLYRQMFRSTLYGIDPETTPFKSIFAAFPKYKRELITGFMDESSPKERARIYELLPDHEKRVLGRYMGVKPKDLPKRPELKDYFKNHPLPDENWEGWKPEIDLEQLRMRAIRGEGLDPMESGIYELQIDEAEQVTHDVRVPTMHGNASHVQQSLNEMLSGRGLKNVRVEVSSKPHDGPNDVVQVQMDLRHEREQDLRNALQLHG
jgi:hypothetical protein